MRLATQLQAMLQRQAPESTRWLQQQLPQLNAHPAGLYKLFSLCHRRFPTTPALTWELQTQQGLPPSLLDCTPVHQAQLWLLLNAQQQLGSDRFDPLLATLFATGTEQELVLLYRSLALLAEPQRYLAQAREGARSNMIPVFLAVAHHNPFAADHFDEAGWNQLVLKAVFNQCALHPILGLDRRHNPKLAAMLGSYVRERWVAQREVPWEIWRGIAPHPDQPGLAELLAQALAHPQPAHQQAAALALSLNPAPTAAALMANTTTRPQFGGWEPLFQHHKECAHVH
ncbi:EboA domain-containing protein [Ferrimonas marina]|uniref:Uncharacterized protein n=1 Tax=Ferrimonas marina TaxID=299255 RepID=A0A1M5XZH3_9GAMM|nr:EboA domain-containing protein [Ferrimonas marina]SHI05089.1 hypothetical protein SAMN02745129_3829 [Ferrimonas marina]